MYRSSPFRSTLNTSYITCLDMCKVCTEAVHSVALWTRVTSLVWICVKYVPKQSIPWHFENVPFYTYGFQSVSINLSYFPQKLHISSKNAGFPVKRVPFSGDIRYTYTFAPGHMAIEASLLHFCLKGKTGWVMVLYTRKERNFPIKGWEETIPKESGV